MFNEVIRMLLFGSSVCAFICLTASMLLCVVSRALPMTAGDHPVDSYKYQRLAVLVAAVVLTALYIYNRCM